MKYTKIPEATFQNVQLNAGVILTEFAPATATVSDSAILGATSGGVTFTAQPSFTDFGEGIDNCPKNTKELKVLTEWLIRMSGSFVTTTAAQARRLIGAGDVDGTDTTKIVPRNDLAQTDFADLWWVGDYSDKNGDTNGGFVAVHMINALSTGGFQIKSGDKAKGTFDFEFTAHYSISAQDIVPFEVYVKAGTD